MVPKHIDMAPLTTLERFFHSHTQHGSQRARHAQFHAKFKFKFPGPSPARAAQIKSTMPSSNAPTHAVNNLNPIIWIEKNDILAPEYHLRVVYSMSVCAEGDVLEEPSADSENGWPSYGFFLFLLGPEPNGRCFLHKPIFCDGIL